MEKNIVGDQEKKPVIADIPQTNVEQALSDLDTGIKTQKIRVPSFVSSVVSISEDHSSAKVKLCTGSIINVPISIFKKVTHLGTVTSGDECLGIASGEIDVSTEIGKFIHQMAREIDQLSRSLEVAQKELLRLEGTGTNRVSAITDETLVVKSRANTVPFDTVLPLTVIKIPVNGIAGNPNRPAFVFYQAPAHQYIQEWEVIAHPNCFFRSPPIVGGFDVDGKIIGLQFFPDAIHGTPIGTPYTATITISVVLVQRTT